MKLIMIRNKKFGDKKFKVGDVLSKEDIEMIKSNMNFYEKLEYFAVSDTTIKKIVQCVYGIKGEDIDY